MSEDLLSHAVDGSFSAQKPALLQVTDVVKKFGDNTAVNGIGLEVHAGEVVSLLGPNGAGKTTTIEMCEGFVKPTSGKISLFGLNPHDHGDQVRSRIGVMLQGGGAYPGIRVEEMLDLVASYSADPIDTKWLLEIVGLSQRRKTTYRRLSGGQQQRLALACALVGRPELLFLDEPTAGLDAQARMAVWDLIRALRRDGAGIILTTHLLDEAEALSDRVIIIDHGEVVASGTPVELTSARRSSITGGNTMQVTFAQDIDVAAFQQALRREEHSDRVFATEIKPRQLQLSGVSAGPDGVVNIAIAAKQCGEQITKIDSNQQSLEDVFLSLTGREMRS